MEDQSLSIADARTSNYRVVVDFLTDEDPPQMASIDGPHTASSSNPAVASVLSQQELDAPDGMKHYEVIYELHGAAGRTTLSGFGDADMGAGTRNVDWSFDLEVMASEAASARVTTGELVPKAGGPAPTP